MNSFQPFLLSNLVRLGLKRGVLQLLVDQEVHGGEADEGYDPGTDQPRPMCVVHDIGGVEP